MDPPPHSSSPETLSLKPPLLKFGSSVDFFGLYNCILKKKFYISSPLYRGKKITTSCSRKKLNDRKISPSMSNDRQKNPCKNVHKSVYKYKNIL